MYCNAYPELASELEPWLAGALPDGWDKTLPVFPAGRIVRNLADVGIGAFLYVLFGTPAETRNAACRTRDFIAMHADRIEFLNVALFNLPVAGAAAPRLATRDFYDGELSLYREFAHPDGWNRDAIRAWMASEFDADPAIGNILARNPPVFTSNHAPFLLRAGQRDGARAAPASTPQRFLGAADRAACRPQ